MEKTLEELRLRLRSNDVVGATAILNGWHPRLLSNLLLATHAARVIAGPSDRFYDYENAARAIAHHEGIDHEGQFPESSLSVIEMAVEFNLHGG